LAAHGLSEQPVKLLDVLLFRRRLLRLPKGKIPVAVEGETLRISVPQGQDSTAASGEQMDSLQECSIREDILEGEVFQKRLQVEFIPRRRMGQDGFLL
jgi:hypothetical protein